MAPRTAHLTLRLAPFDAPNADKVLAAPTGQPRTRPLPIALASYPTRRGWSPVGRVDQVRAEDGWLVADAVIHLSGWRAWRHWLRLRLGLTVPVGFDIDEDTAETRTRPDGTEYLYNTDWRLFNVYLYTGRHPSFYPGARAQLRPAPPTRPGSAAPAAS